MPDRAFSLAQILWDERAALQGESVPSAEPENSPNSRIEPLQKSFAQLNLSDLVATYRTLNNDNRWALCLSGGGIRSAAFALGILQCFADHRVVSKVSQDQNDTEPLLQQFDYLSTVSGGGYIGSWLSAWLYQARTLAEAGQAASVLAQLNQREEDHKESKPINNLRRNSHYLAPRFSALSGDVWTDIASIVRNLLLNWALFVPPMILLVLVTKALDFGVADAAVSSVGADWLLRLKIGSFSCLVFALAFAVANRPTRGLVNFSQGQFLRLDLSIFVLGSILALFVLVTPEEQLDVNRASSWLASWVNQFIKLDVGYVFYIVMAGVGVGLYLLGWLASFLWKLYRQPQPIPPEYQRWHTLADLGGWCAAGAVFGILVAVGLQVFDWAVKTAPEVALLGALVVGVPWIVLARIIADVIFVVPSELIPRPDSNLEYQSRSGGLYALAQLLWICWFGLALFGTWLAHQFSITIATTLAGIGGVSGALSLVIGSSSKTSSVIEAAKTARQYLSRETLAAIAAAIFASVLVISLSMLVDAVLSLGSGGIPTLPAHPTWGRVALFALIILAIILVMCLFINVNRYSLHGLYRNRLVRAFLGASRRESDRDLTKNHFTDFDSADSPLIHELWERGSAPRGNDWKPLHIINAALNLVSSKNLAWQERMAAPFTFSPLHAGSGSSVYPQGAFRPSYPLGNRKPYGGRYGLTLGTAMAISGAAVSPNMGYNSSPGISFLMTLFNVRLGWWLANPASGNPHYWYTGPGMPLRPFVMEMFGLTSENEPWVYLSDGGHFENLGLYEMVRRRCRLIVVSDAGCDPEYQFDDLGNALRKIWIDLGVRIDFVGLDRLKKRFKRRPTPAKDQPYWAVGRIRYRATDSGGEDGLLLYIKAGLHGTECMDVLSYATTHAQFPHETTANQFFTESQFESYRALGFEIAYKMLCYGERSRVLDAAAHHDRAGIAARPINDFDVRESTLKFDHIVERLHTSLLASR